MYTGLAAVMCGGCTKDCDYTEFRKDLTSLFVSFVKGLSEKDPRYFDVLETPAKFFTKLDVNNEFKLNNFNKTDGGFCRHTSSRNI